jgi:hypothetical protein
MRRDGRYLLGSPGWDVDQGRPQEGELVTRRVQPGPLPGDEHRAPVPVTQNVASGNVPVGEMPFDAAAAGQSVQRLSVVLAQQPGALLEP